MRSDSLSVHKPVPVGTSGCSWWQELGQEEEPKKELKAAKRGQEGQKAPEDRDSKGGNRETPAATEPVGGASAFAMEYGPRLPWLRDRRDCRRDAGRAGELGRGIFRQPIADEPTTPFRKRCALFSPSRTRSCGSRSGATSSVGQREAGK